MKIKEWIYKSDPEDWWRHDLQGEEQQRERESSRFFTKRSTSILVRAAPNILSPAAVYFLLFWMQN